MDHFCQKMKFISFLVRSKIWVALAAAGMTYDTFRLFSSQIYFITILHVFFLTLSAYLFLDSNEASWKRPLIYIATTGSILLFVFNPYLNFPVLIISGLLVLTYQTEWLKHLGVDIPIEWRRMPLLKNIVIASSWVLLTTVNALPDLNQYELAHIFFIAGNFAFVLALSIAEDIADSGFDDFPTLVAVAGLKGTRTLGVITMIVAAACYSLTQEFSQNMFGAFSGIIVGIILVITIQPERNRNVNGVLIDGVMVGRTLFSIFI